MTVSIMKNKVSYIGNGIAQSFAIPFSFLEKEHLKVYQLFDNVQTQRTDWTIDNGNLVFETAPASESQIVILREVPLTQETDYRENEILAAETLERNFDKLTMSVQQLAEELERCVKVNVFSDINPSELVREIDDLHQIKNAVVTAAENIAAIRASAARIAEIQIVAEHLTEEGFLLYEYLPAGAVVRIDGNQQEYAGLLFEEL